MEAKAKALQEEYMKKIEENIEEYNSYSKNLKEKIERIRLIHAKHFREKE